MKQRFFKCQRCGQITQVVRDTDLTMMCCMADMLELIPNTSDGATEKHKPVIARDGNKVTVTVGSQPHPMEKTHFIEWICIQTKFGTQMIKLKCDCKPMATFYVADDDEVEAAYAFCNLHGLWT